MMKLKTLAIILGITLMSSLNVSAKENDTGFKKYKSELLEIGHSKEEVAQFEKQYNEGLSKAGVASNSDASNPEMDQLFNEYISAIEEHKALDINDKAFESKSQEGFSTMAMSFSIVEPGDIIYEPDRALGFGHTSVVSSNTQYVVEALSGTVSSLNSTMAKWNDTTSRQRWCWIPSYSSNIRTSAALKGGLYLGKPYMIQPIKLSTSTFYCSQLNWRQYYDMGKDIDRNGGVMVTPDDIYLNDIVKVYLSQG